MSKRNSNEILQRRERTQKSTALLLRKQRARLRTSCQQPLLILTIHWEKQDSLLTGSRKPDDCSLFLTQSGAASFVKPREGLIKFIQFILRRYWSICVVMLLVR